MMPGHMHGILFVRAPLPVHLGQVISGFKAGCRKAEKALIAAAEPQPTENVVPSQQAASPQVPSPQAASQQVPSQQAASQQAASPQVPSPQVPSPQVPSPQAASPQAASQQAAAQQAASQQAAAPPSQAAQRPYMPLFAKGYNDLILRSYNELPVWQNYLRDNPRRLLLKRACPALLRPFFGLQIGNHCYSGIGNRALLAAPCRIAVRVSRRLNVQEVEVEVQRYLAGARKGAVLVSPSISPGEKRVMRAAFNKGLPTIIIVENGFTPLSKPHGEQFYACGRGYLLMLSPWKHHNEKKPLTAGQAERQHL
jgi:hypothetical protein